MIDALVTFAFWANVLRIAIPYVLATIGGAITERAGVVDLALEAKLLFGAFTAAAIGHATGSAYAGIAGGIAAGMIVAAAQTFCALRLGADQVIIGVAFNLIALAGTRFMLQLFYGVGANSPPTPGFGDALVANPVFWIAVVASVTASVALARTRWGLRLRAAGDRPEALVAVGVSPTRARVAAALVGGALAGAGGAQLALAVDGFVADMSGGRGYIALAMVILAGWRPWLAAVACLAVACANAISTELQISGSAIPRELAPLLPYMLTVLVLAIWGGSGKPPRALGKP
ncbi:MAG TPA: ABC transporter permease [Kofleriaceae bacterium]|nr:ABC transporter permease [Kofleriaceae bacterium]